MRRLTVQWILNACGLEAGSITGGPVRFHEIARRWRLESDISQRLMTTAGGAAMLRGLGCELPMMPVRASLWARRERWRAQRLWSYAISSLAGHRVARTLPPCDFVVTVSDYFCDILPALALKRRLPGCHWIAWVHHRELPPAQRPGNRLVNTLTWRMQEWSLRRIARRADAAWVYDTDAGDAVRARLTALGMAPARIRLMRCGIDLDGLSQAPEPAKRVDAAMVGVRPNKGLHDILPVWEELLKLRPGATLRLMGAMSGEAALLADIRRRNLEGQIAPFSERGGLLAPADYHAALKEARLLFAPSHEEGWGMAVCEAMAAGLPVVAYDLPVYRRIYGSAFEAVPCFDTHAFAAALARVLGDAARHAELRAAGLECAAGFGWDAVAAADLAAVRGFDKDAADA